MLFLRTSRYPKCVWTDFVQELEFILIIRYVKSNKIIFNEE